MTVFSLGSISSFVQCLRASSVVKIHFVNVSVFAFS